VVAGVNLVWSIVHGGVSSPQHVLGDTYCFQCRPATPIHLSYQRYGRMEALIFLLIAGEAVVAFRGLVHYPQMRLTYIVRMCTIC